MCGGKKEKKEKTKRGHWEGIAIGRKKFEGIGIDEQAGSRTKNGGKVEKRGKGKTRKRRRKRLF